MELANSFAVVVGSTATVSILASSTRLSVLPKRGAVPPTPVDAATVIVQRRAENSAPIPSVVPQALSVGTCMIGIRGGLVATASVPAVRCNCSSRIHPVGGVANIPGGLPECSEVITMILVPTRPSDGPRQIEEILHARIA